MSPRDLDRAAGLTLGHVFKIEDGKRTRLEQETLVSLSRALRVTLDWLINGEGAAG